MSRKRRQNAPFEQPRTNASRVIHVIGAILRAGRDGDEKVQKSLRRWLAFLTGGGFAVVIALKLLSIVDAQIRQTWKVDDRIVAAIGEQTEAIKDQSRDMKSLVTIIAAGQKESESAHAVLLDRTERKGARR